MGVVNSELDGVRTGGLVFEKSGAEMYGLKLQQVEHSKEDASTWLTINSLRLALAIPAYLQLKFSGVLVVGVYMREKQPLGFEPGIAIFPGPDPEAPEARQTPSLEHIDKKLGLGSSRMVDGLLQSLGAISSDRLPPMRPIGLDLRPRSGFEVLRLDFLIAKQKVVTLRRMIHEVDPLWQYACEAGLSPLLHMPTVPVTIPGE